MLLHSNAIDRNVKDGRDRVLNYAAIFRKPQAAGLLLLVLMALSIECLVRVGVIPPAVVARPSDVLVRLFTLQEMVDLFQAVLMTFGVTVVALALEIIVALPLGYLLFRFRPLGLAYTNWLAALFAAPIFLLYPLFLVIFGRGFATLVVMGFLPGVIPLILQVQQGFLAVSRTFIKVGHSFGLSEKAIFLKIMIPAATPSIFTGFRLALMYTLVNVIAIEYLADIGGLGRIVADRYFRFDVPGTYSAIIAVTGIAVLLNWIVGWAEQRVRAK